ncbi:hypothetical protein EYF80_045392 [Liparis tanakae]|uniref:Uncharacterized protein n=1 Tax=Liparis tanakae TaxID=230148 RepID=A0A4Z2FTA6_9TELE|nr:hypothetical protein EYF80_045392 [Liparis tanakae]
MLGNTLAFTHAWKPTPLSPYGDGRLHAARLCYQMSRSQQQAVASVAAVTSSLSPPPRGAF